MLKYYFRIWLRFTVGSFQVAVVSRVGALLFTFAKLLRFAFFMLIVILVVTRTQSLAGYTLNQSLIFFLTYNVVDTLTQLLFRDVYRFRESILSGYFDYILIKPFNPLFKVLFGGADFLDLIVLVPYVGLLIYYMNQTSLQMLHVINFSLLLLNAFLISAAFHTVVLALGILTTEIDHVILIYRDITSMARFPVDIYTEPLRGFITFVIPVGVMMTFPPKALFGLLVPHLMLVSGFIGVGFLLVSLKLWNFALKRYTSASS